MTVKRVYWSRRPGQFLNIHTGEEVLNVPLFDGTIWDWYNTLADTIFENTTPNQNVMVFSRNIQTILEHLNSYRPFLKEYDKLPNHGGWPTDPDVMKLCGFLSNGKDEKEGWTNSGLPEELTDNVIRIFDLGEPLAWTEIHVKGFF